MHKFPDMPIYTGFSAPSRIEADVADLEVEGTVPADIDGVFFRVGPDPQYPPRLGTDIYFNGDGMISRFQFKNGRIDFKCRYARTEKWLAENAAGHALFGAYRNPFTDDASVKGRSRSTANTNAFFHAGKLYALKEDSPPTLMDPVTLETLSSSWDFGGKLKSQTFTAHPKYDHANGEMIGFGYGAKGIGTPDVAYYVVDAKGKIVHEAWLQVPYPNLMHDFGVTEDYVIWPIVPVCPSLERAKEGKPVFGWDGSKDVYLAVLPRRGEGRDLRLFRAPNQFCSHVMNAFNEGTKIHIDVPVARSNMFPFFPDVTGAPFDRAGAASYMTRWTLDMASNSESWEARKLTNLVGEFPKIDERYACHSYRHGYLCVQDESRPFESKRGGSITGLHINCIGHVDHATGLSKAWTCGPAKSLQEPVFIPRRKDAPEGDGYLLFLESDYDEMQSNLVLLDALHIEDGPVCVAHLPLRLRAGLHGNWIPAERLAAG
ncbi:MAG: carotenoid oxygenase family protein [Alphaproteobacteria bacterium]|nr:carotenoid oxygenase family protein [Alphaproteobacteria bacterium]MDE2014007.1 carotenoid oxygenase family protein [Alphaproteobacteria bacterium]MDE2351897.1 carotenoid oxygenase family protein [Alphaproteobacteria bacterium]